MNGLKKRLSNNQRNREKQHGTKPKIKLASVCDYWSNHTLRYAILILPILLTACTPTVKVATDEPITINLNVNIKHEILVKVDKDLDELFSDDSELF